MKWQVDQMTQHHVFHGQLKIVDHKYWQFSTENDTDTTVCCLLWSRHLMTRIIIILVTHSDIDFFC
jgi:hypothetical protein